MPPSKASLNALNCVSSDVGRQIQDRQLHAAGNVHAHRIRNHGVLAGQHATDRQPVSHMRVGHQGRGSSHRHRCRPDASGRAAASSIPSAPHVRYATGVGGTNSRSAIRAVAKAPEVLRPPGMRTDLPAPAESASSPPCPSSARPASRTESLPRPRGTQSAGTPSLRSCRLFIWHAFPIRLTHPLYRKSGLSRPGIFVIIGTYATPLEPQGTKIA